MISSIAFKIGMSAFVVLFVAILADQGTGPHRESPAVIAIPGAIAALVMIVSFIVGLIAMIWGA